MWENRQKATKPSAEKVIKDIRRVTAIGEAGAAPRTAAIDGLDNDFIQRNTKIMTLKLLHRARMLKAGGRLRNHGKAASSWRQGAGLFKKARSTRRGWQSQKRASRVVGAIATPVVRVIAAAALLQFLPLDDIQRGAFILFAALPPAVINYLLADRLGSDSESVASIVMAGHLASVVVLPLALSVALM